LDDPAAQRNSKTDQITFLDETNSKLMVGWRGHFAKEVDFS
jgi:hypothetical protein